MLPASSLVVTSTGSSLVDMRGLLVAVAAHVAEKGPRGSGLQQFWLPFSIAQAQGFACTDLVVP